MKELSCRDVGMNCDYKMTGKDDEEILRKAEEHGTKDHGMKGLTNELKEKIRAKIHELKAA